MEIKINEIILLVSLLIAVLTYFSAYHKKNIKDYGVSELNKSTNKTFDIMMIVIYLMFFTMTGIISLVIVEENNFLKDLDPMWEIVLAGLILSTIILNGFVQMYFSKKMKKTMDYIFRSQSRYKSDEAKYKKLLARSYLYLVAISVFHGIVITYYFYSYEITGELIMIIVFMFIVLIQVLFSIGSIQAYALRYAFIEYEFVDVEDNKFNGWLVNEDDKFFIIKVSGKTVQYYKKDLIKTYRYKFKK